MSKRFTLSQTDWIKIAKGAAIAAAGALAAYLTVNVIPQLKDSSDTVDAVLYVAFSVFVNVVQKYFSNTQEKPSGSSAP